MLKKIFLAIFILSIVFYPNSVSAQDATDTPSLNTTRQTILKERKESLQAMKAQYQEKRNDFKLRLQTIQDTKKRALVERIDTKISTFNKKMTDKMTSALARVSSVLVKVQDGSSRLSSSGKNTQTLNILIAEAQNAIEVAQNAIEAQTEKEYIVTLTDENSLKTNTGQTVSQFRNDIKDTYKTVIDAKQALVKAAAELRSLNDERDRNTSNSAN